MIKAVISCKQSIAIATNGIHSSLISDFIDHDECSNGTDDCEQICNNHVGGYQCTCELGCKLNDDEATCSGIYGNTISAVVYTVGKEVYIYIFVYSRKVSE